MGAGRRKTKGYWDKRRELFASAEAAKARAGVLRSHGSDRVAHVTVHAEKGSQAHGVSYSVARSYLDELQWAGIEL